MQTPFTFEDVDSAEIARRAAVYGPLAEAVRELVDATIRTTAGESEIRAAETAIRDVTARLRRRQLPGSFGISYNSHGDSMPWGNAAIGLRNPIAPPLVIEPDTDGGYRCEFVLGAAYEGPPGHVHGGVCALVLDHISGVAASDGVRATSTGTLTMRYRRGTPLGPLYARASAERTEGVKTFVTATLSDAGGVTVEAEGIFVVPSWAR